MLHRVGTQVGCCCDTFGWSRRQSYKQSEICGSTCRYADMSHHISSVSKSCFLSIRDLRRIRNTLDFSTARTIATSLIHSKLDYCNSLFHNLPQSQLGRLQIILNSSAQAVSKTPKFAHITPVLKSLHWLKIEQPIQYKVASITYKLLQSKQPSYLHSLLNVQSNRTTRSSNIITLQRPSVHSRLKVTDRSFTNHVPVHRPTLEFSTQTTSATFCPSITRHCYSSTCPLFASVSL